MDTPERLDRPVWTDCHELGNPHTWSFVMEGWWACSQCPVWSPKPYDFPSWDGE